MSVTVVMEQTLMMEALTDGRTEDGRTLKISDGRI